MFWLCVPKWAKIYLKWLNYVEILNLKEPKPENSIFRLHKAKTADIRHKISLLQYLLLSYLGIADEKSELLRNGLSILFIYEGQGREYFGIKLDIQMQGMLG